jgi:tetratricopeptide (TPR) repeat protein
MSGTRSAWLVKTALIAVLTAGIVGLVIRATREMSGDQLMRGMRAYERKDWGSAEKLARGLLKANSSDRQALRLLARALERQGRDQPADAIYRRLGTGFMEAEDYFLLGRSLLNRGQIGPALASLGAARDAEPDHAETLDSLSLYWTKTRMMTDAVDAAERLSKQPGWEVRGEVRLGWLRSNLFDPAGAAGVLADSLRRDPKLAHADLEPAAARRVLARCLLQLGRPSEARAQIESPSGRELDPEGSWLLSRAFLQEGNRARAISALEQARGFGASDPLFPEPAPFLGAARCASCHRDEFQPQQSSRHSRTLVHTADLPGLPWPRGNIPDTDNAGVEHQFRRTEKRVEFVTQVENQTFRAVLEFAMGSNHHGQTFVAREEQGQVRELRVSHYPSAPEWGRTNEHPAEPPDLPGYVGRPISSDSFRRCLHCHSTNFRAVLEPDGRPEARDRGIGCERCHGAAGHHPASVAASFPELGIARPRLASAARIVALCGECHTAPAKKTPDDPGFVRYQASGLIMSRCYTESSESLSCTTCHDPHKDVETRAAFYELKCLKCHASAPTSAGRPGRKDENIGSSCRVNSRGGCLDCHMPRVTNGVPRAVFTDHHIRVRQN